MQPASEKCSYLEELSCKEDSLKENLSCFNQNQDTASAQSSPQAAGETLLQSLEYLLPLFLH